MKYMYHLLALKILGGGGTRQSRRYLSIIKRLYSLKTLDMLLHPWTRQQLGGLKRLQQLGAMRRLPFVWAPWRLHRKYCIDVQSIGQKLRAGKQNRYSSRVSFSLAGQSLDMTTLKVKWRPVLGWIKLLVFDGG